ncbi:winged helix-turn-helix domain-containing protein [Roseicella sp. DB1501]|uniref:winged helix-turn-helix domain-containing protein n=1 Tax=Roseicella sp. DB1501 TaxID=2730925 RepID=UPI00149300C4|nr:LysR family transcriptional regulator [Roseicella sp. DB1501]NOG73654.1 LysR family transcriptional regulator [Roseicella sp. DB1501]
MTKSPPERPLGLQLRVLLPDPPGGPPAMGPGKAELLEGIRDTGSIAAAGRRMGMSYKRAWFLVEAMNGTFRGALVEASKGGTGGGRAALTPLGATILAAYRRLEQLAAEAGAAELAVMREALAPEREGQPADATQTSQPKPAAS